MATRDLEVDAALAFVRERRPFVQPNATYLRSLRALEADIRACGRHTRTAAGVPLRSQPGDAVMLA